MSSFEAVAAAGDTPWHEHVEPASATAESPAAVENDAAEATVDERLANLEQVQAALLPPVVEAARAADLDRLEAQAEAFFDQTPAEAAQDDYTAARAAAQAALGVDPARQANIELAQAAETIALQALGEDQWVELRPRVIDTISRDGQSWVGDEMTASSLGAAMVHAARTIVNGDVVRAAQEQTRIMKEQAQTMSGGSSRPATQTPDEAYWSAVRDAGSGGYR